MLTRMLQRRGTASEWDQLPDLVLESGELGIQLGTQPSENKFKIGDGESTWSELAFFETGQDILAAILDGAPVSLNTLNKIAASINDDATFYTTVTSDITDASTAANEYADDAIATAVSTHEADTSTHGVSGAIVGTTDTQTLTNKTFDSDVSLSDNKITNLANPTVDTDAATKGYVDSVAEGLSVKPAVEAATTANLSGTYNNGTAGVGATLNLGPSSTLSIDGWTSWAQWDGILVKNQTNAEENGRYVVSQVGGSSTDWILRRCGVCDEANEIPSAYIFVQHGDTLAATGWVASVDNLGTFTVGTDDIDWLQFSGSGTYTAGTGLTLTGTEFAVDTSTIATKAYVTENAITAAGGTLTGLLTAPDFRLGVSEVSSNSLAIDFSTGNAITILTAASDSDITITASNYTAGTTKTVYIENTSSNVQNINFPFGWHWFGAQPLVIEPNKLGVFTVTNLKAYSDWAIASWVSEL